VKLRNHLFAFGAKVEDDCMTAGDNAKRYKDFVFNIFNWATVGSYKWRFDKGTPVNLCFLLIVTRSLELTLVPDSRFDG
jgi:hypothetical protein